MAKLPNLLRKSLSQTAYANRLNIPGRTGSISGGAVRGKRTSIPPLKPRPIEKAPKAPTHAMVWISAVLGLSVVMFAVLAEIIDAPSVLAL